APCSCSTPCWRPPPDPRPLLRSDRRSELFGKEKRTRPGRSLLVTGFAATLPAKIKKKPLLAAVLACVALAARAASATQARTGARSGFVLILAGKVAAKPGTSRDL